MNRLQRTAVALAAAQASLLCGAAAWAQAPAAADPAKDAKAETVVVTGRRAAMQSAQKIKKDAEEIVDSIVADEIGKLPDRSVTEVLQRVVGVTIDRTLAKNDPEHYSVEGSSVMIRGLSLVRSELNGRDTFSANGGRSLNFEDVPPELMSGVDIYKNPSAAQIEGAIGGLVNLRTALPFDYQGLKLAGSLQAGYNALQKKWSPSATALISHRVNTGLGEFGGLLSLAHSVSTTRTDLWQVEPYYKLDGTHWVPKGAQWRDSNFERTRDGLYAAAQWRRGGVSSSLSYFESKYKMQWDENALFAQSDPWRINVANATYGANGQLLTGTLSDPTNGGIAFGADTRYMTRNSNTRDLGWNLQWKASDRWSFSTDVQLVRSSTRAFDSTVATGLLMPRETLDLSGSVPRVVFDASDLAALGNKANYYWAFTMEHQDRSKAEQKVWKGDAKFSFDHPVLQDLSFGLRLTERSAITTKSVPDYNWSPVSQTWQRGWNIKDLAYLNDPRFNAPVRLHSFNNFFGGQNVPAVYVPSIELAKGYPGSYATLHSYNDTLCADLQAAQGWSVCSPWTAGSFGTDPAGTNDQKERTQAAFAQLRFDFADWGAPLDGNVGARVVRTQNKANGYLVFTNNGPTLAPGQTLGGVPIPAIASFSSPIKAEQSYTDVLPSLNLRLKAGPEWQFRAALAKAIARPDFSQLQAYSKLDLGTTNHVEGSTLVIDRVNLTGSADGNPMLRPVKSTQADITAEWYFAKTGSVTVALFNKQLKDVIVDQTASSVQRDASGNALLFTTTAPVNGAKGHARGVELSFQRYLDMLPGWMSGFGVQANYTYVDSKTRLYNPVFSAYCAGTSGNDDNLNLNINGCDTDGRSFGDLPLKGLSRNAYNLALLYDHGDFSARVAYSWRSRYLQGVNVNGTRGSDGRLADGSSVAWALPTWSDDYGQVDAGVSYSVNQHLKLSLEVSNLTNEVNRQLMQQQIGMMTRAVNYTGRRYNLQANFQF
ncbi:TonB-dependent receptor [Aquabacterium sp. OR-4]|uniref:TonB-dependent receptor n=1 Tax=Aquabacterium sp. OR-4 TaxID=2978127 RepID=UPI0021B333B1|nr:TonB-dependent receptor [Aquabacterium sp. OR-4]MDT7838354.1 TonB-dependent receptor [Aquabacterium sp. OR-4]